MWDRLTEIIRVATEKAAIIRKKGAQGKKLMDEEVRKQRVLKVFNELHEGEKIKRYKRKAKKNEKT